MSPTISTRSRSFRNAMKALINHCAGADRARGRSLTRYPHLFD